MDIARESGKPEQGHREDDRRPDEEVPWPRFTLLSQQFVVNPGPDRPPPPPRRPVSRSRASFGSRSAKASWSRRKTSPQRSQRPPRADASPGASPTPKHREGAGQGGLRPALFRLRNGKRTPPTEEAVPLLSAIRAGFWGQNAHDGKSRRHRRRNRARRCAHPPGKPDAGVAMRERHRSTRCSWQRIAITRGTFFTM